MLRSLFPNATVLDPHAYGRFLLGRHVSGMERASGLLQYLGGDLFHAKTIARRLGLRAMTYKFTKRSYAKTFERLYATDEGNAAEMRGMGAPPDRVRVVGNLVADAVVGSLDRLPPPPGTGEGICILPDSRPYELRHLTSFFLAAACELVRLRPGTKITFVVSPFNSDEELATAIERPADPRFHGVSGRFDAQARSITVLGNTFGIDRSPDYQAVASSQLVISIPGTKCMEAAVLGGAMLVVVPTNRVDEIAMNGILGYIHRVPLIGLPIKRWVAYKVADRIKFFAQPNIDAGRFVAPELRGILQPIEVAQKVAAMLGDPHELRLQGETLAALYAPHVGAATRMVDDVFAFAGRDAGSQVAR
jgi:lipid-A-disaccharide synthase